MNSLDTTGLGAMKGKQTVLFVYLPSTRLKTSICMLFSAYVCVGSDDTQDEDEDKDEEGANVATEINVRARRLENGDYIRHQRGGIGNSNRYGTPRDGSYQ